MTGDDERKRGILSPADRRYLRSPDEYSRQATFERQNAIRQRVKDSLLDLTVLLESLPNHEFRKITGGQFGALSEDQVAELLDSEGETEMVEALQNGIALLYLAAAERPENHYDIVEEGVRRGETRRGPDKRTVEVTLDVDASRMDYVATQAQEKIERGIDLTDADVRALLETGRVPADEVAEYLQQPDE